MEGSRTDVEMQILHELEPNSIAENDHETPHFAVIGVMYKRDEKAKTSTFI